MTFLATLRGNDLDCFNTGLVECFAFLFSTALIYCSFFLSDFLLDKIANLAAELTKVFKLSFLAKNGLVICLTIALLVVAKVGLEKFTSFFVCILLF